MTAEPLSSTWNSLEMRASLLRRLRGFGKRSTDGILNGLMPHPPAIWTVAVFLLWIASSTNVGAGQPQCHIEVNVADDLGAVLSGVAVAAFGRETGADRKGLTDAGGRVELIGLDPGSYRLEVDLVGYQWLEVEEVHCPPEGAVRLWLEIKAVDGDEVVVLPFGPIVDAASDGLGWWLDRDELDGMPSPVSGATGSPVYAGTEVGGSIGIATPKATLGWQGLFPADSALPGSPPLQGVFQVPSEAWHGEAWVDAGHGRGAIPTGTRGAVTTLDGSVGAGASIGGGFAEDRVRLFVAVDAIRNRYSENIDLADSAVDRAQSSDRLSGFAHFYTRWQLAPSNSIGVRFRGAEVDDDPVASTLFVTPLSPLSVFDRRGRTGAVGANWMAMLNDRVHLNLELGGVRQTGLLRPETVALIGQDQTSDGSMSEGIGSGIWNGVGGIASTNTTRRLAGFDGELEWETGHSHGLTIELAWDEDRREDSFGSGDRGSRLYWLDGGRIRLEYLDGPQEAVGIRHRAAIALGDVWRAGPDVTISLFLGLEDRRFGAGENRNGYRLGLQDTARFGLGVVWDFEGRGRSRTWVRWSRYRPELEDVTHLRMSGGLDVNTVFGAGLGEQEDIRPPGVVDVSPAMVPAIEDHLILGIEYEVLSQIAVGVAGMHRRFTDGVTTLSENGGFTFVVDTPSGPPWQRGLESERWQATAWARKRLANGWQGAVSLQWRKSEGTWSGSAVSDYSSLDREFLRDVVVPEGLVNAWGPLVDDRRWRIEMTGSWTLRTGQVLGGRLGYISGAPVSRLGALGGGFGLDRRFVDRRGSGGRTPEIWLTDVVFSWPFDVGSGVFTARLEIRNLLNRQAALRVDERWTLLDGEQASDLGAQAQRTPGTWGDPLENQKPIEASFGVSYRW